MEASIRLLLRCGPHLKVLSRRRAIQFKLDVANKFPSAVSMSSVSPWRKAKSGMLQSALTEKKERKRGEERERERGRQSGGDGVRCRALLTNI